GGVRGYSFDALWEDYRLSVLWQITTPMWQGKPRLGPRIRGDHLERGSRAVPRRGRLDLLEEGSIAAAEAPHHAERVGRALEQLCQHQIVEQDARTPRALHAQITRLRVALLCSA